MKVLKSGNNLATSEGQQLLGNFKFKLTFHHPTPHVVIKL